MSLGSFKNVLTKWVYKTYIFNIYIKIGFSIEQPSMVDMPSNQAKPNQTSIGLKLSHGGNSFLD